MVKEWLKETAIFSNEPDKNLPEKTHVVLTHEPDRGRIRHRDSSGVPMRSICKQPAFEIPGVDLTVMLIAVLALASASLLAGMITARGAALTEPAQTLRAE